MTPLKPEIPEVEGTDHFKESGAVEVLY